MSNSRDRESGQQDVTAGASVFIWTDAPVLPSRESACVLGGGAVEVVFAEELQALKSWQGSGKETPEGFVFWCDFSSMLERAIEFSENGN